MKPSLVVTGVAGSLGTRLLPLLEDFHVIGLDVRAPVTNAPVEFETMDLGSEASCRRLVAILRESEAVGVVHLAFIVDPLRAGVLDAERMWRVNVAGTARVLEAISEANRRNGRIQKLVHLSSVSVYGPDLKRPAMESEPLRARSLAYALQKKEADESVQAWSKDLGDCETYILRPSIFAGSSVHNYMIDCFRGTAFGNGPLGKRWQAGRRRLPLLMPWGKKYLNNKFQLVHVDDVAKVIVWALHRGKTGSPLTIFNVSSKGEPMSVAELSAISGAPIKQIPSAALCRKIIEWGWKFGATSIPPDAFPYLIGSYCLDTGQLRAKLGQEYDQVIMFTTEAALRDSLMPSQETKLPSSTQSMRT